MLSGGANLSLDKDLDSLPTIGANKLRLFQVLEDGNASMRDVEQIIASDPAMAAKVIKLANSSFYRHARQSVGIHDAIATIGFDMVKCITLSIAVMEAFGSTEQAAAELWQHSYVVALVAFEFGRTRNEKEWLLTGGLLHDLGRMVLLAKRPDEYLPMIDQGFPTQAQEAAVFGQDHTCIGAEVARKWHFPEQVVDIILNHHTPNSRLTALVHVAARRAWSENAPVEIEDGLAGLLEDERQEFNDRLEAVFERHRDSAALLV